MHSKASIAGHPLHPALVALPIGLLVWSFVADLIYIASGKDPTWYDISFYSGLAGILTAMFAALPGVVDYLTLAKGTNVNRHGTAARRYERPCRRAVHHRGGAASGRRGA